MLSVPVAVVSGTAEPVPTTTAGPALPLEAEPLTDGGGDRLLVVALPAVPARPSAVLLAAQQLSDEAAHHPRRPRGLGRAVAERRRRQQRALVVQRRVDRVQPPAG
ncbi:protein of unknown function [Modestobacter italicus]|uniref:Uncharacterized protein n=1 Tax=Modestobacter italicus (strain DSM 44449 / CECT 9708 / BC 501) TaxID=2732864 RepID=I4EWB2_MODI5|nr:hypothetical protein [Modestobacter marinus]CCH87675.1 protein of unknown function [Modestobacter marinus]